jgi:Probable sensor domain DACNV
MTIPAYPAAQAVASRVRDHFARHQLAARQKGYLELAPEPDREAIELITNAAFWASLRREEGYAPKISLAFLPPEQAGRPLRFERPLRLTPDALTHLAPAVERPGIHLGVWREQGAPGPDQLGVAEQAAAALDGDGVPDLQSNAVESPQVSGFGASALEALAPGAASGSLVVWGATRTIPKLCFVLEVVAPGLLVIKHRSGPGCGKFVNVAVIEGDQVKVLDPQGSSTLAASPPLLRAMLELDAPATGSEHTNVLLQLAVSMRAHQRGGALLVIPSGSEAWRQSIVRPISYGVSPPFATLGRLIGEDHAARQERRWEESLRLAVDGIAGLTAVDGATILNDQYDLLAFGAKITRRQGAPQVERVLASEPLAGAVPRIVSPAQLGGTRHISAAQFAQDQPDTVALVASQDGRFTTFAWSERDQMVHAHRIETLLL